VLVKEELVARQVVAELPPQALQSTTAVTSEPGVEAPLSAVLLPEGGGQHLKLRVKVPWGKLSDFVRGVIMPLRSDGAKLDVEVSVEARSESGGIKSATLEHNVKETLRQIGAQILEEFYD